MNKVVLLGRLSKDPEIRYSQSQEPTCVARYTLAVTRRFKREGEPDADFINCVSFAKQGEFVERYLKKGMQIALSGRISVRSYDDNTGQRRWFTEVITEDVEFAESKAAYESRMAQSGGYGAASSSPNLPPMQEPEGFAAITQSIDDDDLPF